MSGLFVTLEGIEGCGKTTQWGLLRDRLTASGYAVLATREPGGTALGLELRRVLLEGSEMSDRAEVLLMAADRAHHVATCLRPALSQGYIVLCDRYSDSTVAYQGYGRGLSLQDIDRLNRFATDGLVPHVTLWFDLDVSQGLARARKSATAPDRLEREGMAFHTRVARGFAELAQQHPDRIARIDGSLPIAEVAAAVWETLQPHLQRIAAIAPSQIQPQEVP